MSCGGPLKFQQALSRQVGERGADLRPRRPGDAVAGFPDADGSDRLVQPLGDMRRALLVNDFGRCHRQKDYSA